ncbi:enoyl-CoA hydratase/isomerase family protein [Sphingomonas sp. ERG5]|uniref:enoyl-CoA hydratase/isomerase family protein n=1 Tax=Sphingomonas sp. ERG5 TaxID=1381597 RepID=UPI0006908FF7|nr:enoyl-CoA hydratase/isomerase family protein [Sphingomonas sp. ERG5]
MSNVLEHTEAHVATITLNRPERHNALNQAMIEHLRAALNQAMNDNDVRAIILTGTGSRAFCAGQDLVDTLEMQEIAARAIVDELQDITRLILYGDKIVIGAVNGCAVGSGFELAMNCDLSIWSSTAGAFLPELALGLGASGASTWLLPHLVGWHRANALFLLGEWQTAQALHTIGLAHAVVSGEDLRDETFRLATRIADLPREAASALKRARIAPHCAAIEDALWREAENLVNRMTDPDTHRRMRCHSSALSRRHHSSISSHLRESL